MSAAAPTSAGAGAGPAPAPGTVDLLPIASVADDLKSPIAAIPPALADFGLTLTDEGREIVYDFDAAADDNGVARLLRRLNEVGVEFKDLQTHESSLEDIFVDLVHRPS